MRSQQASKANRRVLTVNLGEDVGVYSQSQGLWLPAHVDDVLEPGKVSVMFKLHTGQWARKLVKANTLKLRQLEPVCDALAEVPLFRYLPEDAMPNLAAVCVHRSYEAGQELIRQGDVGETFYIIMQGTVKVIIDNREVAVLSSGDYFGEDALLRDTLRNATVQAQTRIEALTISRQEFEYLELHKRLDFPKRHAVAAGGQDYALPVKPPSPKTDREKRLILDALMTNKALKTLFDLDASKCHQIMNAAWKEKVDRGRVLIRQGDPNADYFYIVQDGEFEVTVSQKDAKPLMRASVRVGGDAGMRMTIGAGGSFGELALLHGAPRAATVRACRDSLVWVVDRLSFKRVQEESADQLAKEYMKYLNKDDAICKLSDDVKLMMAKGLTEVTYGKGENIIEQGEVGDALYLLCEGQLNVIKDGRSVHTLSVERGHNHKLQLFGEGALLRTSHRRNATIRVESAVAKVLMLDRGSYELVLDHLQSYLHEVDDQRSSRKTTRRTAWSMQARTSREEIHYTSLEAVAHLGNGGFGSVELVLHKQTRQQYALKMVSKAETVKQRMQAQIKREKDIMLKCNSPFIIRLYETYNGRDTLYFLLELATGGDLCATYRLQNLYGSMKHARFYVASVVLAFEHTQSLKIVHRDLKPENLLLSAEGHVKLADFGLAKEISGKTFTSCGTPDYLAPEVIRSAGHTCAVDWWTLGILLFELMTGHAPFEADHPDKIYPMIIAGIHKVHFPSNIHGDCEDLVKGLCRAEPTERLPMKKGGTQNVKNHKWFQKANWDWNAMQALRVDPPHKPSHKDLGKKRKEMKWVPYNDDGSGCFDDFATSGNNARRTVA
mmetsp:Transcript_25216/g.58021  ORF Transcript_25216/g.58021 Transcript_25216/m.58021 type:complete len:835 (-) Transcript_25216:63-2567(-)